jgi:DegV family protein with EDD domain
MDKNYCVVYDSAASLPEELRTNCDPNKIEVYFSITEKQTNRQWIDQPNLSENEKSDLDNAMEIPGRLATSQPNVQDYKKAYDEALVRGKNDILVIPMSHKLSGSYNSAQIAADILKKEDSDINIKVVKSLGVSMVQGMIVLDSLDQLEQGKTIDKTSQRAEDLYQSIYAAEIFSSLDHLREGGRIGKAATMIAKVMGIRPIIGLEEGVLAPIGKARGNNKSMEQAINYVQNKIGSGTVKLVIMHYRPDVENFDLDKFINVAKNRFNFVDNPIIAKQTNVLNVHSGPGVLGIGAMKID